MILHCQRDTVDGSDGGKDGHQGRHMEWLWVKEESDQDANQMNDRPAAKTEITNVVEVV